MIFFVHFSSSPLLVFLVHHDAQVGTLPLVLPLRCSALMRQNAGLQMKGMLPGMAVRSGPQDAGQAQ